MKGGKMNCGKRCKISIGMCSMIFLCFMLPSCLLDGEEVSPVAPIIDWRYRDTGNNDEVLIGVRTNQVCNITICFTDPNPEGRLNKGVQSCRFFKDVSSAEFGFHRSSYATGHGTVTITAVAGGMSNTTSFSV